jgi:hypothetical protein
MDLQIWIQSIALSSFERFELATFSNEVFHRIRSYKLSPFPMMLYRIGRYRHHFYYVPLRASPQPQHQWTRVAGCTQFTA